MIASDSKENGGMLIKNSPQLFPNSNSPIDRLVVFEGNKFYVLYGCLFSKFAQTMITGDNQEKNDREIVIEELPAEDFHLFLKKLTLGSHSFIKVTQYLCIMASARRFFEPKFLLLCEKFVGNNINKLDKIDLFKIAFEYNWTELKEKLCTDFFQDTKSVTTPRCCNPRFHQTYCDSCGSWYSEQSNGLLTFFAQNMEKLSDVSNEMNIFILEAMIKNAKKNVESSNADLEESFLNLSVNTSEQSIDEISIENFGQDFTDPSTHHDRVIVVEGRKFYVIAERLSIGSEYFLTMFTSNFKEKDQPEIAIEELLAADFHLFLKVVVNNSFITDNNYLSIITSARRFLAPKVLLSCEKFVFANFDKLNKVDLLAMAFEYDWNELKEKLSTELGQHTLTNKRCASTCDPRNYKTFCDSCDSWYPKKALWFFKKSSSIIDNDQQLSSLPDEINLFILNALLQQASK